MTAHTFVATESGPCVILATGNRRDDLERVYPRSEVALRYGAGSEVTTTDPKRHGQWEVRHPEGWACQCATRSSVGGTTTSTS